MNLELLRAQIDLLSPSVVAVALCFARLLPVAFLCPLLGGQAAPTTVKLALVLSLALFLHHVAGVSLPAPVETPIQLAALVMKELSYGTSVGLVAALPFDAARMGGRFIDLFRGTSAEASLPVTGTRESATGDALYQLLVGLVVTGGLMPVVLSGLVRGFGWVRLGAYVPAEAAVMHVVGLAGGAMATGLAVGAPVAAAVMAVDCLLGMVSRAAPQVNLQEMGAPLRILAGGALLWLAVGILCERLLASFLSVEGALFRLGEVAR
ncbi:EscT/YscT/HrcT family type III secretion system export apparatus protein [Vitiosangium sp. GDMCC 1.1324]|uniref:EscT/YscT/HrcT family type III secretion system export apparatus protein n=1 Tax=Vitiosangium sp. (strain GDMCC 1.1324) TaxID=2138576 RepID=UPI000D36B09D|nr:flagellar biosynthetic protein FliR [Vitiosangium sp. GDMCC 1.1324]PTL78399.1 type III secretion protein [Vitiosangium sp. GDMCC 1.1324]